MKQIIHPLRIITVHFLTPHIDETEALIIGEEFESLIATLGGTIVYRILERHDKPNNATFIGSIVLKQIARRVKREEIDVIILNANTKARQIHQTKQILIKENAKIEVWDRIDLILQIFDKHATTTEAKLQIQLAKMKYMGPRIYGMGYVLSRQGGGIGTSGIGETNTELMKRHWRSEIKKVKDQLEKLQSEHLRQLERRKRTGLKTVSIVGYTNAGKSALFLALTKKAVLIENVLFATLDSTVGKIYLPELQKEVIVTDTIGFIRKLPPSLISAFTSTLMESIHADLLLHVIDITDPEIETKIRVVNQIIRDLGRYPEDMVYVFNKIDAAVKNNLQETKEKYSTFSPLFVSAKTGIGITDVKKRIAERLA